MFEFDAGVGGCEVPVGLGVVGIAVVPPCGDFLDEGQFVGNPAVEALGRQDAEFGLRQIKPTAMLWSVVPFEALNQPPGFDKRSLTFAGDVPEGWSAQLMRGNFDRLSRGAADAARQATEGFADGQATNGVALLVSCIGRRLLMGQRVSEEIEAAGAVLGTQFARLGFYSYGEISPHVVSGICELHNQTMTITTITELVA